MPSVSQDAVCLGGWKQRPGEAGRRTKQLRAADSREGTGRDWEFPESPTGPDISSGLLVAAFPAKKSLARLEKGLRHRFWLRRQRRAWPSSFEAAAGGRQPGRDRQGLGEFPESPTGPEPRPTLQEAGCSPAKTVAAKKG